MWKKVSASALALSLTVGGFAGVQASAAENDEVTRGEYVKTLIEAMGVKLGTGASVPFKEVPDSLKPYIEKAVELKLITGKSATIFAPDEKISRQHAFVIVARGIQDGKTYSEDALKSFNDNQEIGKSYRTQIAKLVELGFFKEADSNIYPKNFVTKESMEKLLQEFLKSYSP